MIKQELYLRAADVSKQLSNAGVCLEARDGSILRELVEECFKVDYTLGTTALNSIMVSPGHHHTSTGGGGGKTLEEAAFETEMTTNIYSTHSKHSVMVLSVAKELEPYVLNHISTTKNIVKPLVFEFAEKLSAYVQQARSLDPSLAFSVEQGVFPNFLMDETFQNYGLSQYSANSEINDIGSTPTFKSFTDAEKYKSLMTVSNKRLDVDIGEWLASLGNDFIENVFHANFDKTFQGTEARDFTLSSWLLSTKNPYDAINVAVVYYLYVLNLKANPEPIHESMSASVYMDKLNEMEIFASVVIAKQIQRLKQSVSSGILVVEYNLAKKRVVINRVIYQDWLTKGGSVDVLLGLLVSGVQVYGATAILDKIDSYKNMWTNYLAGSVYTNELQLKQNTIRWIEAEVAVALSNPTELEKEYFSKNPSARELVMQKVTKEIEHLSHNLLTDLEHTALHIIAKARFYYTAAYDILGEMVALIKKNPNMDPREAGTLATIKYVVQYLMLQVVACK